jgi:hypothetical protein
MTLNNHVCPKCHKLPFAGQRPDQISEDGLTYFYNCQHWSTGKNGRKCGGILMVKHEEPKEETK